MLRYLSFVGLLVVSVSAHAGIEECHGLVVNPRASSQDLKDCLAAHKYDAPSARSQLYVASKAKLYACMDEGGCAAREVGDAVEGTIYNAPRR
jgi:hypothetical protein